MSEACVIELASSHGQRNSRKASFTPSRHRSCGLPAEGHESFSARRRDAGRDEISGGSVHQEPRYPSGVELRAEREQRLDLEVRIEPPDEPGLGDLDELEVRALFDES